MVNPDFAYPLKRSTDMSALDWVEWISEENELYRTSFLKRYDLLWMAEDMAAARPGRFGVEVKDQRFWQSALLTAGDWAIHEVWKRHKIVYDIDPTLQQTLSDMETRDVLPGDVMRQLPHPNPLFVWPAGHKVTAADGRPAIVHAMYVNGQTADKQICATSAPEAEAFQLTFRSDLLDDQGRVETPDSVRMSFALTDTNTTIDAIVTQVLKQFVWEPLMATKLEHKAKVDYMGALVRFGVAHLLYTCSEKADVDKPKASRTISKGKNRGQPTPGAVLSHPVGWRIGPAIKQTRERLERESDAGSSTGRTVAPHVRRAHLHTFRYGKGRQLKKVKWLPPIFVNADGEEFSPEGTIVRVTT